MVYVAALACDVIMKAHEATRAARREWGRCNFIEKEEFQILSQREFIYPSFKISPFVCDGKRKSWKVFRKKRL